MSTKNPKEHSPANADYLASAGSSALGGRIRRLSERIDGDVGRIYKAQNVRFEQRWFGVMNQLSLHGNLTVTELSTILQIRHASVSQTRTSLERAGLVRTQPDPADGRSRIVLLSAKGKRLVERMRPTWGALDTAASELEQEAGEVIQMLARLEAALDRKSLFERAQEALE